MACYYTFNHVNAQLYEWVVHIDTFLNKLFFNPKFLHHIISIISYIYNEEQQLSSQAGGL